MVVDTVNNPAWAAERIIWKKPDAVFIDLERSKLNVNTLMQTVYGKEVYPEFVFISDGGDFDDLKSFFKAGGFDYLLKPVDFTEFEKLLISLTDRLDEKCGLKCGI